MPASTELLPAVPRALLLQAVSRALGVPLRRAARPGGARKKKLQTLRLDNDEQSAFLSITSLSCSLSLWFLASPASSGACRFRERERGARREKVRVSERLKEKASCLRGGRGEVRFFFVVETAERRRKINSSHRSREEHYRISRERDIGREQWQAPRSHPLLGSSSCLQPMPWRFQQQRTRRRSRSRRRWRR